MGAEFGETTRRTIAVKVDRPKLVVEAIIDKKLTTPERVTVTANHGIARITANLWPVFLIGEK